MLDTAYVAWTNVLRLLCGPKRLFSALTLATKNAIEPQDFYDKKLKEQSARHAKFNDTAYNLEPNIKESPGGLRDLNMVLWIAQSQGLGTQWNALSKNNIITKKEARLIRRAMSVIYKI
jgi:[protein-PII] uridylyltransferase